MKDGQNHDINLRSLLSQSRPFGIEPEAYHGLAGEVVEIIAPHSEADPVALLASFLVGFGNLIGDSAHFVAEADRHPCRLFAVLVGKTSKGRKGSSWAQIEACLSDIDPDWKITNGLSSGEGLIWNVRDSIKKQEPTREQGKLTGYETVEIDSGIEDKRLMVVEGEFSRVLKTMTRDQNTLSPVLRGAWDSGKLNILTKNSPAGVSNAHISLLCHITKEELNHRLNKTDIFNGFANRFLWLFVERSKELPEGGSLDPNDLLNLQKWIRKAVEFARGVGEMKKSDAAKEVWAKAYSELSQGRLGPVGAATSRAEAQAMRLACIYALLDLSEVIESVHINAGLAVCDYSLQSCQYIFDSRIINRNLIKLLDHLEQTYPDGLSRTDIRDFFNRHKSKEEIESMTSQLHHGGVITPSFRNTEGRRTTLWTLAEDATKATKDFLVDFGYRKD